MGRTVRVLRLNRISLSSRLLSQDIAGLHPPPGLQRGPQLQTGVFFVFCAVRTHALRCFLIVPPFPVRNGNARKSTNDRYVFLFRERIQTLMI
jgi:hypothetical protein